MLFILNGSGVPSIAKIVQVGSGPAAPTLASFAPSSKVAGEPTFTLTVNGSNFVSGATVRWNGQNRTTTFVSETQLTASIPAADIAAAGTASVTVQNPPKPGDEWQNRVGGPVSNALTFTITGAPPYRQR
jgi:IPT/TIG domain